MEFKEYLKTLSESSSATDNELNYLKWQRNRLENVFKAIPRSLDSIRILDIGTTPFTFFIKENYPNYEVSTIDLTNIMKTRCQARNISLKICNLDDDSIPFQDNYFDAVIFTEVLEHIFNPPSNVLKEIRRIIKQNGLLILSVPNIATLYNRIRLLLGITPLDNPDDLFRKDGHGHIHEYTLKEITNLVGSNGFTISSVKYIQPAILNEFNGLCNINSIISVIYRIIAVLIPAFRTAIYIECYKQ